MKTVMGFGTYKLAVNDWKEVLFRKSRMVMADIPAFNIADDLSRNLEDDLLKELMDDYANELAGCEENTDAGRIVRCLFDFILKYNKEEDIWIPDYSKEATEEFKNLIIRDWFKRQLSK